MAPDQPPSSPPPGERPLAPTPQRSGPRKDQLARHSARFLDPSTAVRFDSQQLASTVYAGDQLLLRPTDKDEEILDALRDAAGEEYRVVPDAGDEALVAQAEEIGIDLSQENPLLVRVRLERREGRRPTGPPDAWPVLQAFRSRFPAGDPRAQAVQLEHLLTSGSGSAIAPDPYIALDVEPKPYIALDVRPNPYIALGVAPSPYIALPYIALGAGANPYIALGGGQNPTASYAQPGSGGRTPVVWVGPRPTRRPDDALGNSRRPVVAVLDTGAGHHPWFEGGVVQRDPTCHGVPIGFDHTEPDIERTGIVTGGLTGSLDLEAGHGTFIAGLVHQRCPDATILAVRVVQPDGIIHEYDVLQALNRLWLRQKRAQHDKDSSQLIDVVSLSMGYYHEDVDDVAFDPCMLAPLRALGRAGVVVVVSAGNDATSRPMYPAAFAPHRGGAIEQPHRDELPVVAVGALNPDRSVALFSNDGPWVQTYRPGAALMSTMPTTFDGGASPTVEVTVPRADGGDPRRETIDPDDFRSGYATWSGTSFASPVLAGDVAAWLNAGPHLRTDDVDPTAAVDRGWLALEHVAPAVTRPRSEL